MEADDELVPSPDTKGYLDLTSRAWVNIDPVLWTMASTLTTLDLSYNHIKEIPPQIGLLAILKEFRCSFNKIQVIPAEIGKLKRLRRLFFNSNRLKSLPTEIGRLEMLEEFNLSENIIEELPHTISLMSNLRVLKLQNNKLTKIPYEIAEIITLEEVDCANNPSLGMIPAPWRGDTDSVLFICRLHREYHIKMDEMSVTNSDLIKHSQFLEQEQLVLKEAVADLKFQSEELKRNLPKNVAKKLAEADAAKNAIVDDADKKGGCIIC